MNKTITLFDLDHTLLPLDSNDAWVKFLYQKNLVQNPEETRRRNDELMHQYHIGEFDMGEYVRFALEFLTHYPLQELAILYEQYYQSIIRPVIYPQALELVRKHLEQGDLCILTSATHKFLVKHIADAFGFDHIITTQGEKKNGYFTGDFIGLPNFRENKVINATQWLKDRQLDWSDFDTIYAYSDSINDLALLEKATHPVATNPCPKLRAVAQTRQWDIIDIF